MLWWRHYSQKKVARKPKRGQETNEIRRTRGYTTRSFHGRAKTRRLKVSNGSTFNCHVPKSCLQSKLMSKKKKKSGDFAHGPEWQEPSSAGQRDLLIRA